MDLGSCNRTHSNKVKAEFATKMAGAVAEKDLQKIAELNRLTVEYEQNVGSFPRFLVVGGSIGDGS